VKQKIEGRFWPRNLPRHHLIFFFVFTMATARTVVLAAFVGLSTALQSIHPFSRQSFIGTRQTSALFSYSESELQLVELLRAKAALNQLNELQVIVKSQEEGAFDDISLNTEALNQDDSNSAFDRLISPDMPMEDLTKNIVGLSELPFSMQLAIIELAELPEDTLLDVTKYPVVVDRIRKQGKSLTPKKLREAMQKVQEKVSEAPSTFGLTTGSASTTTEEEAKIISEKIIGEIFDGKTVEEVRFENLVKQHLGRATRKDGISASLQDLETLVATLAKDKSIFVSNGKPEPIPGGYLIRGKPIKKTGQDVIEALDAKLPADWVAQVSYIPDFTMEPDIQNPVAEPVLILLNKDFSPEVNKWLLSLSTLAGVVTTFLFGVGVYAGNDAVTAHLNDLNAISDPSGMGWFNGMLAEVLIPIAFIQILHELGHLLVAWKENIKTSPPTLLPFWILPFMGAKTQLKSSPKNLSSMFDFAFLGPFMGIVSSLIFLVVGLQMTLIADSAASMYFPTLPVELLRCSTLGGTIVDTMFGGSGYITSQADTTNILLHPFAVAGFTGLVINALSLLPLGSTDGGRMSQALFGRGGHLLVGGVTWFSLLLTTLALDQNDVLLGAWVVYNIAQNDQEIPCRDEVDNVNIWRAAAGFGLWFIAVLALVPLDHSLV
jgi:hypothetical protein